MLQQDFSDYFDFLKNASIEEEKNSEEELALNICSYHLDEHEVPGEAINWILQYLTVKKCPKALISPIINNVVSSLNDDCIKSPEENGYDSERKGYNPLSLHKSVFTILRNYCQKLLDNSELSKILPVDKDVAENSKYVAGAVRNGRRCMEDRHVIIEDFNEVYNIPAKETEKASFYAVFDGHDGYHAAYYSVSQLPLLLAKDSLYPQSPDVSLRTAFKRTDDGFAKKCDSQRIKGGTTAVCALYRPVEQSLYIAWVGDSKALIAKKGQISQIVKPHKPEAPEELKRIEQNGGCVVAWAGSYRVNGLLSLSRAIGDSQWKSYVISDPDIEYLKLDGDEDFLVLACDGLWDYVQDSVVSYVVYRELRLNPENVEEIPQRLIDLAKFKGSSDNISIIVVFLKDTNLISKDSWSLESLDIESENACKETENSVDSFASDQGFEENLKNDYAEKNCNDDEKEMVKRDVDVEMEMEMEVNVEKEVTAEDEQKSFDLDLEPETCVDTLKVITNEAMMSSGCEFGETLHNNIKMSSTSSANGVQFEFDNSLSADDFTDNSATQTNLVSSDVMAAELNPSQQGSLLNEKEILKNSEVIEKLNEFNVNLNIIGATEENTEMSSTVHEPTSKGNALESSTSEKECPSMGESTNNFGKSEGLFYDNLTTKDTTDNILQFDDEQFNQETENLLIESELNSLIGNSLPKSEKDGDSFVGNFVELEQQPPPPPTAMTMLKEENENEVEKFDADEKGMQFNEFLDNNAFKANENLNKEKIKDEINTLIDFSLEKSIDAAENLKNLKNNNAIMDENRPHESIGDAVAESEEDSEDEWKYLKPKDEKNCGNSESEVKNIIECSNENQIIDTNPFTYDENLEKLDKPEKSQEPEKEVDTSELMEQIDDMATSQLNPEAKEFVPSSPTLSVHIPPVAAMAIPPAAIQNLNGDDVVAQSPRKGIFSMEDIPVPTQNDFEIEISHRPSEINENFDESCVQVDAFKLEESFTPLPQSDQSKQNESLLELDETKEIDSSNIINKKDELIHNLDNTEDLLNTVQQIPIDPDFGELNASTQGTNIELELDDKSPKVVEEKSAGIETSDEVSPLTESFANELQNATQINLPADFEETKSQEEFDAKVNDHIEFNANVPAPQEEKLNEVKATNEEDEFGDELDLDKNISQPEIASHELESVDEVKPAKDLSLDEHLIEDVSPEVKHVEEVTTSAISHLIETLNEGEEIIEEFRNGDAPKPAKEVNLFGDVKHEEEEFGAQQELEEFGEHKELEEFGDNLDQPISNSELPCEEVKTAVHESQLHFEDVAASAMSSENIDPHSEDLTEPIDDILIKQVVEPETSAIGSATFEDPFGGVEHAEDPKHDVQSHIEEVAESVDAVKHQELPIPAEEIKESSSDVKAEEILTPSTPSVDTIEVSESEKTTDTTPIDAIVLNESLKQAEVAKEQPKSKKEIPAKAEKAKTATSATKKLGTTIDTSKSKSTGTAKTKPSTLSATASRPKTAPAASKVLSPSEKKTAPSKPKIEGKTSSALTSAARKPLATKAAPKPTEPAKPTAPKSTVSKAPSATRPPVGAKTTTTPAKPRRTTLTATKTVNQSITSPNQKVSSLSTTAAKKPISPRTTLSTARKTETVKSSATTTTSKPPAAKQITPRVSATTKTTVTSKVSTNVKSTASTTTTTRKVTSTLQKKPVPKTTSTTTTTKSAVAKTDVITKSPKQVNAIANNHVGNEIKVNGTKTE